MRTAGVASLPTRRIAYSKADGELIPAWLSDRDRPWLRDLLAEARAFVGRPLHVLVDRLGRRESDPRAGRRHAIAVHVLVGWLGAATTSSPMTGLRQQLFRLAAAGDRARAIRTVAEQHGICPAELTDGLFSDLPANRIVHWPDPPPEPGNLAWRANLALVRAMLRHSQSATIRVRGAARALLKTAWLLGAAVQVEPSLDGATQLIWRRRQGATSHRALTALLQLLPWAQDYELRADCCIGRDRGLFVLATGDAIQPGPEPRLYDSQLERRFADDFVRALPAWRLLREPAAVTTAMGLAFPDFELRAPGGGPAWLCELAGLRDPSALPAKLALLAAHPNLVLCLPQRHLSVELRAVDRIVAFRQRVPIAAVRDVIERHGGCGWTPPATR